MLLFTLTINNILLNMNPVCVCGDVVSFVIVLIAIISDYRLINIGNCNSIYVLLLLSHIYVIFIQIPHSRRNNLYLAIRSMS